MMLNSNRSNNNNKINIHSKLLSNKSIKDIINNNNHLIILMDNDIIYKIQLMLEIYSYN
jgi:hypothetical protein